MADQHCFRHAAVIVPPVQDFYFTPHRFSTLGALIVEKLLIHSGIHVSFLNFPLLNTRGTPIELPLDLAYLRPYLIEEETGPLSFFKRFRQFGPPVSECAEMVAKVRPDICFFSLFAFCYADPAIDLAKNIREKLPDIPMVFGGSGASVFPEYFLKMPFIDHVISGEAEVSLIPFMHQLSNPETTRNFSLIPNLSWKEGNQIKWSLKKAFASESQIVLAFSKNSETKKYVNFSASFSRGCPKQCDFCSSHLSFGTTFRNVSANHLKHDIFHFSIDANNYKKQVVINFEDDNMLCDPSYLQTVIEQFRNIIHHPQFLAENGLDYSLLTSEICEWLIDNGLKKFNLSLGSCDHAILSKQSRFLHLKQYELVISLLAKREIPSITYFICGFKEDTQSSIATTLSYLSQKKTLIGISLFYPVPGLRVGFTDLSKFENKSSLLSCGSAAFPWNGSVSTETMITAFRLSRYINLLKDSHRSQKNDQLIANIRNKRKLFSLKKERSGKESIFEVPRQDLDLNKIFFEKYFEIG